MIRCAAVLMAIALLPAAATAQGGPPQGMGPRMEAQQQQRAELERQVRQRFMEMVAARLELSQDQQERLHSLLAEGAEARRAIAEDSRALRIQLMQTVRNDDAADSTYERILARIRELRQRERALEEREATGLAAFLNPRQQAMFLTMRMQLNDRIRRLQGGMMGAGAGGGAGVGAGGGPGGPPF